MMGDSTQRQVWATFVSSFQGKLVENGGNVLSVYYCTANDFERNAKEWTRENVSNPFLYQANV